MPKLSGGIKHNSLCFAGPGKEFYIRAKRLAIKRMYYAKCIDNCKGETWINYCWELT